MFPGERAFYLRWRKRLRALREQRGLTQEQVAEALDVTLQYYQALEWGTRKNPTLNIVMGLAKLYDLEPYQILMRHDLVEKENGSVKEK